MPSIIRHISVVQALFQFVVLVEGGTGLCAEASPLSRSRTSHQALCSPFGQIYIRSECKIKNMQFVKGFYSSPDFSRSEYIKVCAVRDKIQYSIVQCRTESGV